MANLFERLSEGRQQEPTPPPAPLAAGMLLGWIQNKWTKSTISPREIRIYGPGPIRDRESALKAAEALERRGFLVPMKTNWHGPKRWRIAIGD